MLSDENRKILMECMASVSAGRGDYYTLYCKWFDKWADDLQDRYERRTGKPVPEEFFRCQDTWARNCGERSFDDFVADNCDAIADDIVLRITKGTKTLESVIKDYVTLNLRTVACLALRNLVERHTSGEASTAYEKRKNKTD